MTISDGFTGASFFPQPYKEKDDKNKTKEPVDEDPKKLRKKNAINVTVKKLK